MCEQYGVEVVSRLVVTEHEKWDHGGATQHQCWQDSAGGARHLQPGCSLPTAEVCYVVQEETGEGHKVSSGPGAAAVFVDRLDP